MAEYSVSTIKPSDIKSLNAVDEILRSQNLKRDNGLDCIAVVRNEEYEIVATGSALGNTLRCFAVKDECKGEGILNLLVTYLVDVQIQRGNSDIFLYTKPSSSEFFRSLGFHEIAKVENKLVFMENKSNLFNSFLDGLSCYKKDKRSGCIVMNANPFTKGHRYLVEQALKDCDVLHVFIVSEDKSEIPFSVRKKLVEAGLSDLKKVIIHDSGSYIISNATFPSYFLENDEDVMTVHASLDANIFVKIASAMGIDVRFVGSEPFSKVTSIYNNVLSKRLPESGIELKIIERLEVNNRPVSASDVRLAVKNRDFETLSNLVPSTTLEFFLNSESSTGKL